MTTSVSGPSPSASNGASRVLLTPSGGTSFSGAGTVKFGSVGSGCNVEFDWTAYMMYEFLIVQGSLSATQSLTGRVSTDGGATFISTNNYASNGFGYDETNTLGGNNGSLAAQMNLSQVIRNASSRPIIMHFFIPDPSNASFWKTINFVEISYQINASGNAQKLSGFGHYQGGVTAINGFQIGLSGAGNISGKAFVWGHRG